MLPAILFKKVSKGGRGFELALWQKGYSFLNTKFDGMASC